MCGGDEAKAADCEMLADGEAVDRGHTYARRLIARAHELQSRDAFEPAWRDDFVVTAAEARALARADGRATRRLVALFALFALALVAFSLLLPYYGFDSQVAEGRVYAPSDVLDCYVLWFKLNVVPMFDPTASAAASAAYDQFSATHETGMYVLVTNRAAVTVVAVVCGIMLALSGLLFQTAFRNPLAAPTTLGVSDGVTIGCIVYAALGHATIGENPALYLALVYGLGAAAVLAVLFASRVMSGGERYNVLDMLLLGTVVCQLLGGISGFIQNFQMDYDAWYNFYELQQATNAVTSPLVCTVVLVVFAVTFIPALLLRWKLNLIAFPDEDGTMMGARAGLLRGAALVLGSVMELATIATFGQVAVLSLAVPFAVRYMLPADFRSQFLGNSLLGTVVLLACVVIQNFAVVGGLAMPVGTIVSIFIVPVFIWMIAFGKGRW